MGELIGDLIISVVEVFFEGFCRVVGRSVLKVVTLGDYSASWEKHAFAESLLGLGVIAVAAVAALYMLLA